MRGILTLSAHVREGYSVQFVSLPCHKNKIKIRLTMVAASCRLKQASVGSAPNSHFTQNVASVR